MDSYNLMRAFRRIVELGGMAKAADDLGVSTAGLSKQLRALETHLGVVLLQRTTRRMSLTEPGQAYFQECCRLLDDLNAVEKSIREQSGKISGRLRVNAALSFALSTLSPLIVQFLQQYPALKIDLVLDDHLLDAVGSGFDVSIRLRASLEDSSLVARRLGTLTQRLCAAPSYLQRHSTPQSSAQLQDHELLSYSLSDSPGVWQLEGPQGLTSVALPTRASVNNSVMLRDLIVAGLGIGALPSFLADPYIASGQLTQVLPDEVFAPRHVYAIYPTHRHLQPKVKAFVDFLLEALPGELGRDS